ncbi:MAG: methyltransferase [Deltaproteobacteria bacterium]|nr:methyltransferase [Deltaproteobacteria bacterium]
MASSRNPTRGFDPFGWLEKWIPTPYLHRLIQLGVIAILIVFLMHRMGQYKDFLVKPLWVVETLIFVVFLVSYAIRIDPLERSRGFREIVVPLIGAALPFVLLLKPPNQWIASSIYRLNAVLYWMTAASSLTLWGLWTLRRSFSITVEARALVTGGPYRWVRHPIYLGEMLTAGGVLVWRFSPENLVIFIIFVLVQILRARWEEGKLTKTFPEYKDFAAQSKWI